MRLKSRGMIVSLLSKVVDLITAIVISFVKAAEAFEYSVAKKGIAAQVSEGSDVKREKVYCRTNSMAAIKWTSRKNLSYITKANRDLSGTESGQTQGYTVFKGG